MEYIDTHAHIYLEPFNEDIEGILQRAETASVFRIYMPNIDSSSIDSMLELEKSYPDRCRSMIGLHPCSVKADFEKELKIIEYWLEQRVFVGIGETGTDLYWEKTFREQQVEALKIQINWAEKYNIPIILHSRESLDLTIKVIEDYHSPGLSGIFHCFNGNPYQARQIMDLGFYIGIGGVVTFKNSNMGEVLESVPIRQIVLETDSPYLTPVPYRGKRNEPSYIPFIAEKLVEVYKTDIDEIAKITTYNARKVFKEKESEI